MSSHSHLAAPAHAILRKHPSAYTIFFEDDNTYEEYCLDQFPHAHVEIGPARLLSQSLPFPSTLRINGYDATYRGDPAECLYLRWIHQQSKIISNLSNAHQLERFALFIRYDLETNDPTPSATDPLASTVSRLFNDGSWDTLSCLTNLTHFDDCISQNFWICLGTKRSHNIPSPDFTMEKLHKDLPDSLLPFGPFVNHDFNALSCAINTHDFSIYPNVDPVDACDLDQPHVSHLAIPDLDGTRDPPASAVLHPHRPGTLPNRFHDESDAFKGYFGICFEVNVTDRVYTCYHSASPFELMSTLLFGHHAILATSRSLSPDALLNGLHSCLGMNTLFTILNFLFDQSIPTPSLPSPPGLFPFVPSRRGPILSLVSQLPSSNDWTREYTTDPDTSIIFSTLSANPNHSWTTSELNTVDPVYRGLLRSHDLFVQNHRILYRSSFNSGNSTILLIVVPQGLQRLVFKSFHSSPSAGHMGRHATLLRLRLRFFWPRMSSYIAKAISQCPDCILGNSTNRPSTSLLHGSIANGPWVYVHLDAWVPGDSVSFQGDVGLLNAMDDLSSAVIVTPIQECNAAHFGRKFLENVLLRVGITGVVVVDADSKFRDVFQQMCAALKIRWVPLARGNHKGLKVERFHRFLNKNVKAECRRRGTNKVFPETALMAAYAWNSAPTDDSDITRSYVAFGVNFKFPMDVDLEQLPHLLGNDTAEAINRFISQIDPARQNSQRIVQWLNDDRHAAHRERINANRKPISFQQGDCVTVRVQHQSNAATNRVKKLEWDAKGPFEITEALGHDAYKVKPFGRPDLAARTYKTDQLRKLPPSIQPCSPLDTINFQYLNLFRAPILHPYQTSLGISSYNHLWLDQDSVLETNNDSHIPEPFAVTATNENFISMQELSECLPDTDVVMTDFTPPNSLPVPTEPTLADASPPHPTVPTAPNASTTNSNILSGDALYQAILASRDKLFFIRYIAEGTMTPTLQLVQVNLDSSQRCSETISHRHNGRYYTEFLARLQSDASKTLDKSRWRTIWHEYTLDNGNIVYSDRRREFSAGKFPDPDKYIAYADFIHLDRNDSYILGPFDFADPGNTASGRSKGRERLEEHTWQSLVSALSPSDITLPNLSSHLLPDVTQPSSKRSRPSP